MPNDICVTIFCSNIHIFYFSRLLFIIYFFMNFMLDVSDNLSDTSDNLMCENRQTCLTNLMFVMILVKHVF